MGIFIALGAVFIIRLFMLQVVDRSYKELADNNALRYVTQYPARGKIFDRNGQLLVFNEAVYAAVGDTDFRLALRQGVAADEHEGDKNEALQPFVVSAHIDHICFLGAKIHKIIFLSLRFV